MCYRVEVKVANLGDAAWPRRIISTQVPAREELTAIAHVTEGQFFEPIKSYRPTASASERTGCLRIIRWVEIAAGALPLLHVLTTG